MGCYMKGDANYVNLWKVYKIIFLLSHDQADIESRVNFNSELLVENMKKNP